MSNCVLVFCRVTAAAAVAAALSAVPAAPAVAKIDCARLKALVASDNDRMGPILEEYDTARRMGVAPSKSVQRRVRNSDALWKVYTRNCSEFMDQTRRDTQGEMIMQGLLGAAIGVGGSYLGGGGRGHGHAPRARGPGGSAPSGTPSGHRHF